MRKIIFGVVGLVSIGFLQGCFCHSTEIDRTVPASSSTVVTPSSGSTVTTTTNP